MNEGMSTITEMARIDLDLFDLRKKMRLYPRKLEEARKQLDAEQVLLDELQTPWDEIENQIAEKEATIVLALETIEKFEEHMARVNTQKEYMAAKKQVDEARKLNSTLQNDILEARVTQEEMAPRFGEVREHYNNVLETFQKEESRINKEKKKTNKEVVKAESQIQELAGNLGVHAFPYYERLVKAGKLPTVVPVIASTCSGCKMTMPAQAFNLVIANPTEFHTCPHCSRIVYYLPPVAGPEEEESAEGEASATEASPAEASPAEPVVSDLPGEEQPPQEMSTVA